MSKDNVITAVAVPLEDSFNEDQNSNIPMATNLHVYEDSSPEAQNLATAHDIRRGQNVGRVKGHEEREQIKKENYHNQVKPSIESARISNATDIARQRYADGFEVKTDKYFNVDALEKKQREKMLKEQQKEYKKLSKPKGYQTSDYETSDYETKEYTGYEYKSVYD